MGRVYPHGAPPKRPATLGLVACLLVVRRFGSGRIGQSVSMSNSTATTTDNAAGPDVASDVEVKTTVAGMSESSTLDVIVMLQKRLVATLDLQLTLKHIHWNVVGMNFIAVHEMLDPQVDAVRIQSDEIAERIATLGGEPLGTPEAITSGRSWSDYRIARAPTVQHLAALDHVYGGVIGDHRAAAAVLGELDPVSEDLLIGHLRDLELFQWFIRAHLKDATGDVIHRSTFDKS
jgi:starvation-inducible DNA-binding protein